MRISDWSSDVCSSDLEVVACGPIEAECHRLGVAFDVALQRDRKAPADMRGVEQRTVGAVVDIQLVAAALFDAHDQRAIFGGPPAAGFAPKLGRVGCRQAFADAQDSKPKATAGTRVSPQLRTPGAH